VHGAEPQHRRQRRPRRRHLRRHHFPRRAGRIRGRLDPSLHRILFRTPRIGLSASSTANQFWPAAAGDRSGHVLWLCYYDTSGSSNKRRVWFTCTASRNGRVWAAPVRASSQDSLAGSILADAYSYGGYVSVAAAHGVAHPAWIDTREAADDEEDVFTAAIPARRVLH
jgi:hypothetical protein